MRKIKTMADIERTRRRNNIILGVVMIFLLVASSAGYSLMSADNEEASLVSEKGFDFVRYNGLWRLDIGEESFLFQRLPSEVEEVEVNVSVELGSYSNEPIYFVNPGEGVNEVLGTLGQYALRYQESCLQQDGNESRVAGSGVNYSCEGDLPVKDCSSNLIIFEEGNETKVYSEGNCVFIVGDVVSGSDAFLYEVLGI